MTKEIILRDGGICLVDDEDFDYINQFTWYRSQDELYGYAFRSLVLDNGKRTSRQMSRDIMKAEDRKIVVDHINHNVLDNRKDNLRLCSHRQNMYNRNDDIKGYSWDYHSGKWNAYIKKDRLIHLGSFDTEYEAIVARRNAEIEYFGEFANLSKYENSPVFLGGIKTYSSKKIEDELKDKRREVRELEKDIRELQRQLEKEMEYASIT